VESFFFFFFCLFNFALVPRFACPFRFDVKKPHPFVFLAFLPLGLWPPATTRNAPTKNHNVVLSEIVVVATIFSLLLPLRERAAGGSHFYILVESFQVGFLVGVRAGYPSLDDFSTRDRRLGAHPQIPYARLEMSCFSSFCAPERLRPGLLFRSLRGAFFFSLFSILFHTSGQPALRYACYLSFPPPFLHCPGP